MTVDLAQMMKEQAAIQLALGGSAPADRPTDAQLEYIKEMVLAATDELHEALAEVGWKSWSKTKHINRDAFVSELIDTMQFLMNLFSVVGCDADEIREKLTHKHEINRKRIATATNGLNKCPSCKRALDDVHVACTSSVCAYAEGISA